ncbi:MAG TPA: acetate--CoA ligase family protein [Candidatus Polarisedimenticolia bacterium]|nr:acetate--CoA ligase family protein [Candidatus Polarisedimenticolia bacterium]
MTHRQEPRRRESARHPEGPRHPAEPRPPEEPAHPLARLFDPRGVAVIGASETPGKYGTILLTTLIEQGYTGGIHPVNPKGGALLGRRFLPSLEAAEGPIDLALIVRPAPEVLPAMRQVARQRIPFAIVYAAGFSEHGEEGRRLERRLVEAAGEGGTRVVGPNCMNIYSAPARLNLSAIPFNPGGLSFLSASGNLGFALGHEASRRPGLGFARFISAGNQADLALDDYLDYLRTDKETRVVLVFAEGFARGGARRFLEVLERTAATKPVLLLRGARTRAGQGTALSHTGALAGESDVARQALEQAGAVLLDRADEALAIAGAFLDSPLPAGPGVALVGEGGGHATLLTDGAVEAGLRVEPFPPALIDTVRPHLPPFAAIVRNPVEFGGRSEYDLGVYRNVLGPVLDWPGCDQAIVFGGYALYDEPLAEFLARRRRETGKPILIHDLYADEERPAFAPLRAHALPLFTSAEVAARAAGALARGAQARRRARRAVAWRSERQDAGPGLDGERGRVVGPGPAAAPLPADLRAVLTQAGERPGGALREEEAAALLARFGVPVLPAGMAGDEEDAVRAAERLGYPVVVKVHAEGIIHKTEVGGVHLDLRDAEEVRTAWRAVARLAPGGRAGTRTAATPGRPEARLTPFRRGGIETIAGARRDPHYGPLLLFGAGGVLAEVTRDVALRTLPCPDGETDEMIEETRVGRLLHGARGAAPVDPRAVAAVLRALARLLLTLPEISDVEVNPLRCAADGVEALDARVLVTSPTVSPADGGSRRR